MPSVERRETLKLLLRRTLLRADLGVLRDPAPSRLRRTLDAARVDTVVDVGANSGQFACLLRAAGFRGRIISFEPLPQAYERLQRRSSRDANWFTSNVAIGAARATATLNISRNSYSSSIRSMTKKHLAAAPNSETVATVQVQVARLDELFQDFRVTPATTMLKIDTQGYEDEVLNGVGDSLQRISVIQLELSMVTLYSGQALFDALYCRMNEAGFRLHSIEPGICDEAGRMLQFDGVFVRDAILT